MTNGIRIKDLPVSERPYEKLEKLGPGVLSNAELLAVVLGSGSREDTSVTLAQKVLAKFDSEKGMSVLHDVSAEELKTVKGIGRVKALQIKAVLELSKRISSTDAISHSTAITTPADVSKLFMEDMRYLKKEIFKIILLNTKNHIIKLVNVSMGSLNSSIVHPREVFSEAVRAGCSGMILIHNHPSGDPEPSRDDIETTERLSKAGTILGIKVLDHIVIGDGRCVSFKEKGLI